MNRNIVLITAVVLLLALAALAFAVFRTPEEASAPIEAVPLAIETPGPATAPAEPATVEPAATAEPTATATPEPTATAEPVAEPIATAAPEPTTAPEPVVEPAAPAVFEIVPAESQARFIIDEVLRGAPVTVVGATDQVAGQIAIDVANPGATQVGQILVNARTLATDNDFRNRAIKNQILNTNSYEFISFQPTELAGLPEAVAVGQPFSFQIAGDLTIRDVTRPVTFAVTVTPASESRIEGLATATFPYRDFNLAIPDAPSVDTVADDVTVELEFVAVAQ